MKNTTAKVSEREKLALMALYETYSDYGDEQCIYFRTIAERSGLPLDKVRRTVRALARKGLAVYERGLFDDDGMVAGSGYRCSEEGAELASAIEMAELEKKNQTALV